MAEIMRCLTTPGDEWNESGAPGHHACKLGIIVYTIMAVGLLLSPVWGPIYIGIEGVRVGSEMLHEVDWPSYSKDLDGYLLQHASDLMRGRTDETRADKRQGLAQAQAAKL